MLLSLDIFGVVVGGGEEAVVEGWEGWEGRGGTSVGNGFKPYTMYNVICAQDNYQLPLVIGG